MMRVTDLDKFALEQVWRPYQRMLGYQDRLANIPVSLEETAKLLAAGGEWSELVLARISQIGVEFPAYVKHPLVDVIQAIAVDIRALKTDQQRGEG